MTSDRNALSVEAVLERFSAAETLLADAALRVHSLGDATASATQSSATLSQAGEAITAASEQLVAMTVEMQLAHRSLVEAMNLARAFLEGTDVAAMGRSLTVLAERLAGIEKDQNSLGEQLRDSSELQAQWFEELDTRLAQSSVLEQERDEARRQLAAVMRQLPGRVTKKLQQ